MSCRMVFCLLAMKLGNTWTSLDGTDRIGIPDPDPIHICVVCVMFKCYHGTRNDILDGCIAQNDFSEIDSKALFLARHFAIDFLC